MEPTFEQEYLWGKYRFSAHHIKHINQLINELHTIGILKNMNGIWLLYHPNHKNNS
jgi:hypothetical protein